VRIKIVQHNSGVPQGSILGPLLFNFYISDINDSCLTENVNLKFFADDLKSYVIYSDQAETHSLQAFITKFSTWCDLNDLKVSIDKCRVLYIGNNPQRTLYFIKNIQISAVEECIRDLGILISPDLRWKSYIDHICKSANTRLLHCSKLFDLQTMFLSRVCTQHT
jgi:ribonucleases P/MRP protein subunit RPP40